MARVDRLNLDTFAFRQFRRGCQEVVERGRNGGAEIVAANIDAADKNAAIVSRYYF